MAIKEPGKKEMKTLMDLDPDDPRAAEIMAKICIPHAESEAGKQKGVIPPWAVQYPKSEKGVKPKSGDVALKKYREKLASGGPAFPVEMKDVQIGQNGPDDLDPLSLDDVEEKPVAAVKRKPRESVPERTIFMPLAANMSENTAAPSMKSSIRVTSSKKT